MFYKTKKRGFTLIEALVLLFIFSVISLSFYSTYLLGTKHILESKNKLGATALAAEKMEIVRNLEYDDIGTKKPDGAGGWLYGIPPGEILESETVVKNTREYYVFTFVRYVDDSYDGLQGGAPNDGVPNDYKQVRVKVAWENDPATSRAVVMVSNFSPEGVETAVGGGTLSINVLDTAAAGIANARVHIRNIAGGTDVTTFTDATGNVLLPGTPAGSQQYLIEIDKEGYYSAETYPDYPTSTFHPANIHATVAEGLMNTYAFITDHLSQLTIETKDPFDAVIGNIDFNLTGGYKLGDTDDFTPLPVYAFDQDASTDGAGTETFSDMSVGTYTFTPNAPGYEFIKLDPGDVTKDMLDLPPGSELTVKAVFADPSVNSILITAVSGADNNPIESASVHVTNSALGYDATVLTDRYGQAFFPAALPELTAGDYEVAVSAANFDNGTTSVPVSGLEKETVTLNPL